MLTERRSHQWQRGWLQNSQVFCEQARGGLNGQIWPGVKEGSHNLASPPRVNWTSW